MHKNFISLLKKELPLIWFMACRMWFYLQKWNLGDIVVTFLKRNNWGAFSEEFIWAKHENHAVISFPSIPINILELSLFFYSSLFPTLSELALLCFTEIIGNFLTRFKSWKNLGALILDIKDDELNVGTGGVCFCFVWYGYRTSLTPVFTSFFIFIYMYLKKAMQCVASCSCN